MDKFTEYKKNMKKGGAKVWLVRGLVGASCIFIFLVAWAYFSPMSTDQRKKSQEEGGVTNAIHRTADTVAKGVLGAKTPININQSEKVEYPWFFNNSFIFWIYDIYLFACKTWNEHPYISKGLVGAAVAYGGYTWWNS